MHEELGTGPGFYYLWDKAEETTTDAGGGSGAADSVAEIIAAAGVTA
jgi:hypothetical protein